MKFGKRAGILKTMCASSCLVVCFSFLGQRTSPPWNRVAPTMEKPRACTRTPEYADATESNGRCVVLLCM